MEYMGGNTNIIAITEIYEMYVGVWGHSCPTTVYYIAGQIVTEGK
jgi:hypothetical protein